MNHSLLLNKPCFFQMTSLYSICEKVSRATFMYLQLKRWDIKRVKISRRNTRPGNDARETFYSNPFLPESIMEPSRSYIESVHFYCNMGDFLKLSDYLIFFFINKQSRTRSEGSYKSPLIWFYYVCLSTFVDNRIKPLCMQRYPYELIQVK